MKTCCNPYAWWVKKIEREEPFTLVRIGDGELNGMIWTNRKHGGGRTKNGDGHSLRIKEMRQLLRKSIKQPPNDGNYYRSLWMDGNCRPKERLARDHCDRLFPGVTWYNALAIHFANVRGYAHPFYTAMRNQRRPVIVVGPPHLRHIDQVGLFDYHAHVEVPYHRAFFARERIVAEALAYPENALYTVHAGPAAPVITWMLWKERGETAAVLDLGSVFDGYVHERYGGPVSKSAALTRSFWKKRATREILRRNLTGE